MKNWLRYSPLEIVGLAFGVITIAMMVVAAAYAGDVPTERMFNGHWADPVLVYYEDAKGWHMRHSKIEHFGDATVGICYQEKEHKPNLVKCWVHPEGGTVLLLELPLMGESAT